MTTPSSGPLEYQTRRGRRRRPTWRIWLPLILLSLAASGYYWRSTLQHWFDEARFAYAIRACTHESPPPDQVVWTNEPADGDRLLASSADYRKFGTYVGWVSPAFERLQHTPVGFYGAPAGIPTSGVGCWWPDVTLEAGGDVFVHERVTRSGKHLLMIIRCELNPTDGGLQVTATTFGIGTFDAPLRHTLGGLVETDGIVFGDVDEAKVAHLRSSSDALRVFAGVADPLDPSKVNVRYRNADRDGEFHVQVLDAEDANATFPVTIRFSGTAMDAGQ